MINYITDQGGERFPNAPLYSVKESEDVQNDSNPELDPAPKGNATEDNIK